MSKLSKPVKNSNKIINYWKKEPIIVLLILIFGLGFNILTVFWPIYQGKLLDAIVNGEVYSKILRLTLVFIAIVLLIQTLRFLKRFYIRRFANITSAAMRLQIFNNIIFKSASQIKEENIGNLMTRTISDTNICVEGMRKFTTEIFDTGVLMISYLVMMLIYDIKITLFGIIFIPVAMFLAEKLKKVIYKFSIAYRQKSEEITDITYDMINNSLLYRVNGREQYNSASYNSNLEDLKKQAIKANILENSMQPVYNIIAMLGIIFVIYFGGKKTIDGTWSLGDFSAYITMFIAMAVKASKAAKLFNSTQKSQVSWQRIKPYLGEYQVVDKDANWKIENTYLEVDNLSFSYDKEKENIIENISFTSRQGEIIGITGAIASGKSALAIALTGLYDYLGHIKIDGKELKEYSPYERSQMISYLSHKPQLISDTIYNNITLGNDGSIREVLHNVCFDEDLQSMPEKENTLVGNSGIRLSGGQQSRLALARALYRKSKIIILDDPFSAVDMETEKEIINNLKSNYKNSLVIIVSHRLAIFDQLDRVLLLNSDKTYFYDKHQELLEKSKIYSTIYSLQSNINLNEVEHEE